MDDHFLFSMLCLPADSVHGSFPNVLETPRNSLPVISNDGSPVSSLGSPPGASSPQYIDLHWLQESPMNPQSVDTPMTPASVGSMGPGT